MVSESQPMTVERQDLLNHDSWNKHIMGAPHLVYLLTKPCLKSSIQPPPFKLWNVWFFFYNFLPSNGSYLFQCRYILVPRRLHALHAKSVLSRQQTHEEEKKQEGLWINVLKGMPLPRPLHCLECVSATLSSWSPSLTGPIKERKQNQKPQPGFLLSHRASPKYMNGKKKKWIQLKWHFFMSLVPGFLTLIVNLIPHRYKRSFLAKKNKKTKRRLCFSDMFENSC